MAELLLDNLLPIAIAIIMLGIGVNLKFNDFTHVFVAPKAILTGLLGQILLLPLVGFLIAWIVPLEPIYKIGIILIASCPGGTSSNIVTFMLRGRVALSVSITAFNSFLIILTIPFLLSLAFFFFFNETVDIHLSFAAAAKEIGFTVLLPVIIGISLNEMSGLDLRKIKRLLRYLLPTILFVVFAAVILVEGTGENGLPITNYLFLFIPLVFLNIVVMFIGFYIAKWLGINHKGTFTIAIELGLQNSALAIFIANNILQIEGLATMAVIYGGFSFFSTLGIAYFMKKKFQPSVNS
jgi:BASS family bile acid:Na+ symporter